MTDLPENASKEISPVKRYGTIKTYVLIIPPAKPPVLKHGYLIDLLNDDLETSEDALKESLDPHNASDLEEETAKHHNKDWPPP